MADDFYLIMPNFVHVSVFPNTTISSDGDDTPPTISSSLVSGGTATQWKFSKNRPQNSNNHIWDNFAYSSGGLSHYFNAYTSTNRSRAYFSFQLKLDIFRYSGNFIGTSGLDIAECQDGSRSVWWCGAPNLKIRGSDPPDDINARIIVHNEHVGRSDEVIFFDSCGEKSTHSVTFSA